MKRIFTILCALALVMAGSATAMAAEPEAGQSASYYSSLASVDRRLNVSPVISWRGMR